MIFIRPATTTRQEKYGLSCWTLTSSSVRHSNHTVYTMNEKPLPVSATPLANPDMKVATGELSLPKPPSIDSADLRKPRWVPKRAS
jgi:hypothetical protein